MRLQARKTIDKNRHINAKTAEKNLNGQIHTQTEFPTNAENADEKMIHVNDGPALSVANSY